MALTRLDGRPSITLTCRGCGSCGTLAAAAPASSDSRHSHQPLAQARIELPMSTVRRAPIDPGASSQWPRAGASFATRRSCLESGHRSVRPHPGDAMPAIHQRPGLRSAAVAALCALACACAQVPSRDASVAGASPAVDPATGSVRVLPDPAPAPHPGAHAYTLDPVHTRIVIAVDHA